MQTYPRQITALQGKAIRFIAAGGFQSFALTEKGTSLHKPTIQLQLIRRKTLCYEAGTVYSFGYGGTGALGHGTKEDHYIPSKIVALRDQVIVSISAGLHHSLALNDRGTLNSLHIYRFLWSQTTWDTGVVFSFGTGRSGQLGLGSDTKQLVPTKINTLAHERIAKASAGSKHSLFLSEEGRVYSCGYSKCKQTWFREITAQ